MVIGPETKNDCAGETSSNLLHHSALCNEIRIVCCVKASCSVLVGHQCFGGTSCFHVQASIPKTRYITAGIDTSTLYALIQATMSSC
jgi:hypothetical protein